MKILLINVNPVVGKLVTLSAQKTGDELTSVGSMQELSEGHCDLLIIDDACYDKEQFASLPQRVKFSKSCFIGSRTTERPEGFSRELNKPFLPTDLVDIFVELSSEILKNPLPQEDISDEFDLEDSLGNFDELDETFGNIEEMADLDETLELDDILDLGDSDLELDDSALGLDDAFDATEEASDLSLLDEDLDLDNLANDTFAEEKHEGVLDEEDLKEVKELLEETDEELLDDMDDFESEEIGEIRERPLETRQL